eukprot:TRINITY_DN868_c0_g1_i1.p1 TRINITY_DN868_c0_g1~~TRINITY_DN868_c0_g1_i1.p1  ORF type:complete len:171 (-),score=21.90 TRINITY_DN868_c0_g1_i1:79-591(-)
MEIFFENFRGPEEYGLEDILTQFQRGIYRMFVLFKHDVPGSAGFVITASYAGGRASQIEYLAVRAQCQGKGLGSLAIQFLAKQLQHDPIPPKVLTLECEKKLCPFYQKYGFEDLGVKPKNWVLEKAGKSVLVPHYFLLKPLSSTVLLTKFIAKRLRRELARVTPPKNSHN